MKFPTIFQRTAAFSDAVPTGPLTSQQDNLLKLRAASATGLPVQRVAVVIAAPAAAPAISCTLYFFDQGTGHWYKLAPAARVTPTVAGTEGSGQVAYFDAFSVVEPPINSTTQDVASGALQVVLVPTNPGGLPAGTYTFAMAPVLINTP